MEDDHEAVVIDIGTGSMKAGFCYDDAPKFQIPMVLGKAKNASVLVGMDQKEWYIGQEALDKKQHLNLQYPVVKGRIKDKETVKQDIHEIFENLLMQDLLINQEEYKFMVTEPPNNPREIRESFCQLMFEDLKVQGLYLGNQAVLSLFATGKTTGTVLDAGEGVTHTVPIYEGYAIPHFITEIPICGNDLTQYLMNLLIERHPSQFSGSEEQRASAWDAAIEIKHKFGQVALDFDAELKTSEDPHAVPKEYKLPSQHKITVTKEALECPEILFQPSYRRDVSDENNEGIHQYTYQAIIKCVRDIWPDLFKNIVLAGGCTMFKGMQLRMKKEVQALAPSNLQPDVESPADRKYSAWLGGAILSSMSKFDPMWIKRSEYEEDGENIVARKCF